PPQITERRWLIANRSRASRLSCLLLMLVIASDSSSSASATSDSSDIGGAGGQVAQLAVDRGEEVALDRRTALAHLAHAIEVMGLGGVVLGLLGEVEQRVVDVLEQVAQALLQALAGDPAHSVQQLAHALA